MDSFEMQSVGEGPKIVSHIPLTEVSMLKIYYRFSYPLSVSDRSRDITDKLSASILLFHGHYHS